MADAPLEVELMLVALEGSARSMKRAATTHVVWGFCSRIILSYLGEAGYLPRVGRTFAVQGRGRHRSAVTPSTLGGL